MAPKSMTKAIVYCLLVRADLPQIVDLLSRDLVLLFIIIMHLCWVIVQSKTVS